MRSQGLRLHKAGGTLICALRVASAALDHTVSATSRGL